MELIFDKVDVAMINKEKKRKVAIIYAYDKDSQVKYRIPYFLDMRNYGYENYELGQFFVKTKNENNFKECKSTEELISAAVRLYNKNRLRVLSANESDRIKLRD